MATALPANESTVEALLRAQLAVVGRTVFSPRELLDLVVPTQIKGGEKQLLAYNLCDGSHTQSDVAKHAKLDQANFSRTVARWIDAGVLFKVPAGTDTHLQHLYPIPVAELARRTKEKS